MEVIVVYQTIEEQDTKGEQHAILPFFEQSEVEVDRIPVGAGVPIGITRVSHQQLGIGGAYGTWGEVYDNKSLTEYLNKRLEMQISDSDRLDLEPLGFLYRHHITNLTDDEHYQVELEVGSRFIGAALQACGWQPEEVDAVLIGISGPIANDFTEQIAAKAGIRKDALKVTVHKACDSSVSALHIVLNPELYENKQTGINLAEELRGKKVLVGGIEGLSRFTGHSRDLNALQLFGNGAGIIGVIPGKNLQFLVGKSEEVFDEKGLLAVRMFYPHSHQRQEGKPLVEVTRENDRHIRIAGMMKEPDGDKPIEMAGLMGMVKLFVRSGVNVVRDVYQKYLDFLRDMGLMEKSIRVAIVHHANFKINKLKNSQLMKEGIQLAMPWLLSEFGNVSAASSMIAFLRQLPFLNPGDHILFDGFGAGTYYDVFAIALGEPT
jgi:3-oxoacyl-[acyl-carrier-protein] synthase III